LTFDEIGGYDAGLNVRVGSFELLRDLVELGGVPSDQADVDSRRG
jgi:hypothetical protein